MLAACAAASAAHATTIVAIRTPDAVTIAADSVGTARGGGAETTRVTCKIFVVSGSAFAIAGLAKVPGQRIDFEREVAEILRRRKSIADAAEEAGNTIARLARAELLRLRSEDAALFRRTLEEDDGSVTAVLLATVENGQPLVRGVDIRAREDSSGGVFVAPVHLACSGECEGGEFTLVLGKRKEIDRHAGAKGKDSGMSPEDRARFYVQLEIDAGTRGVGPPVDVVRMGRHGVAWIARKPDCRDAP
jgi:hypothetical protein